MGYLSGKHSFFFKQTNFISHFTTISNCGVLKTFYNLNLFLWVSIFLKNSLFLTKYLKDFRIKVIFQVNSKTFLIIKSKNLTMFANLLSQNMHSQNYVCNLPFVWVSYLFEMMMSKIFLSVLQYQKRTLFTDSLKDKLSIWILFQ
jgi:hypothetical protein